MASTLTKPTNPTSIERSGISKDVVLFLREHEYITGIDFVPSVGVNPFDIATFEMAENIKLPEDYKSFLLTSDGFKLQWSVSFRTKIHPLGSLQLNKLINVQEVKTLPTDEYVPGNSNQYHHNAIGMETTLINGRQIRMLKQLPTSVKAYVIDTVTSSKTKVALLYGINALGATNVVPKDNSQSTTNPQVWYQDHSQRWFFISSSFIDYFRLMVTHLGLPGKKNKMPLRIAGTCAAAPVYFFNIVFCFPFAPFLPFSHPCLVDWQASYTDVGLDPTSKQWLTFLTTNNNPGDGTKKKTRAGREATASDLFFGAFSVAATDENTNTKGLATLRNVTGQVDDMTSPVIQRNGINGGNSTGMGMRSTTMSKNGGNVKKVTSTGNASNWFDLRNRNSNSSSSNSNRNTQRPGSAPMRRNNGRRNSRR